MNAVGFSGTSAANEAVGAAVGAAANVSVQEQEPVLARRRDRRAWRRFGDQGVDRLTLVGCERGDGGEGAFKGVTDQHGRAAQAVKDLVGGGDVCGRSAGGGPAASRTRRRTHEAVHSDVRAGDVRAGARWHRGPRPWGSGERGEQLRMWAWSQRVALWKI